MFSIILITVAAVVAAVVFMADAKILGPVDTSLALQAAAVTKTASFNGATLDLGSGFAPGGGGRDFQASIPISALDFTTGDETYKFELEESADNSTFTKAGALVSALSANVGSSIQIHGTVQQRYVRYALTIAGTTPSITYGPIYLVPKR